MLCRLLPTLEHDGLAVTADVGDQLDALGRAHEGAPLAFLSQCVVVAHLGHAQGVAQVARTGLKDACKLLLVQ